VGEIFRQAILENCAALIMAHNHPSGDPAPSPDDVALTRAIAQAGKLLDIEVLDHLVIAGAASSRSKSAAWALGASHEHALPHPLRSQIPARRTTWGSAMTSSGGWRSTAVDRAAADESRHDIRHPLERGAHLERRRPHAERRLKNQKNAWRLCPVCNPNHYQNRN